MRSNPTCSQTELALLLDNYKVLLYNGAYDVIVNTAGVEVNAIYCQSHFAAHVSLLALTPKHKTLIL